MATTIPIDAKVRDRLRLFGHAGQTYNEILTHLMNEVERKNFLEELRREKEELDRTNDWVREDAMDWD